MAHNTKGFAVAGLFTFFILFSVISLQMEDSLGENLVQTNYTNSFIGGAGVFNDTQDVSGTGIDNFGNSVLGAWDYVSRIADTLTIGIFLFDLGIFGILIRLAIILPLQVAFYWMITELIRGN